MRVRVRVRVGSSLDRLGQARTGVEYMNTTMRALGMCEFAGVSIVDLYVLASVYRSNDLCIQQLRYTTAASARKTHNNFDVAHGEHHAEYTVPCFRPATTQTPTIAEPTWCQHKHTHKCKHKHKHVNCTYTYIPT